MKTLTSTLVERVQASFGNDDTPNEVDSPLLSKTAGPVATQELALQLGRAENALTEIALEVQAIAQKVRALADLQGGQQPTNPPSPVPPPQPVPIPEPDEDDVPEAD